MTISAHFLKVLASETEAEMRGRRLCASAAVYEAEKGCYYNSHGIKETNHGIFPAKDFLVLNIFMVRIRTQKTWPFLGYKTTCLKIEFLLVLPPVSHFSDTTVFGLSLQK